MESLTVEKINFKRKFGLIDGELRGHDESKLMNPPIELEDNYDWIRDDKRKDEKVLKQIKAENDHTDFIINPHKELVDTLYKETKKYIRESYDTFASLHNLQEPWKYFIRFKEGKDYHSHWRKKVLSDNCSIEEELLNINLLAEGKKQCDVTSFDLSPNHKYFTYGVDYDGSEKYEFVLVEIETRQVIETDIPKLAYCSYEWVTNDKFYYLVGDDTNRMYQLWLYDLSNKKSEKIFEEKNINYDISIGLTDDENYLVLSSGNYDTNWCSYIDYKNDHYKTILFLPEINKVKYDIEHYEGTWFIHTNKNATNWGILKLDENKTREWENLTEFIQLNDSVYIGELAISEKFFTFKTKINGNTYINIIDPGRKNIKILTHLENKSMTWEEYINQDFANIKSELVFTISYGVNPIYQTNKLNILFTSMIKPTELFDYDVDTLECNKVYEKIVPNYNSELYESKRIWVEQEGTKLGIPVSIIYRKDLLKNDCSNPLYLYGYGSYGMTINPAFSNELLPILDRGYVYAIAHVRGGAFLGYNWYEAGRMENKINTFNDFIKCAEYFKQSGFVDPNKIVIEGRSAGGLLVGASLALRPDLFWITLPGVPFVDILNTMSDSTIPLTTEEWTQWGNPNEKESFKIIKEYCPYYNIKQEHYPHMYCTAGLHDPRVPYWEIMKVVAKIREFKTDSNVQAIRIETSQGHFGGSSRYKSIEELAEKYAFILTR